MKMSRVLILATLPFMLFSCKDDDGSVVRIKNSEHLLYIAIKEYRNSNGQDGPFVHQYLMVEEAQLYSYKMANGFEEVDTLGFQEHWETLDEKFDFYNRDGLVLRSETGDEDQILTAFLQIPGADAILLKDVTQCGVGIEIDTSGVNYITILLAKADS